MTLNLQIVLAIMGVIVVILICLISWWQNRMRRPSRDSATAAARAGDRVGDDAIADDGFEAPRLADDLAVSPDRRSPMEHTDDARTPVFESTAGDGFRASF